LGVTGLKFLAHVLNKECPTSFAGFTGHQQRSPTTHHPAPTQGTKDDCRIVAHQMSNTMNQSRSQDQISSDSRLNHENRLKVCNRTVADLHQRALSRLIEEDERGAVLLWKQALQHINSTANACHHFIRPKPSCAAESTNACASFQQGSIVDQENTNTAVGFIHAATFHLSPVSEDDFPSKIFTINKSIATGDEFPARQVNGSLAVIVVYHVAASLHRVGIQRGVQDLLSQSLTFYELASTALGHVESIFSAREMGILSMNITNNTLHLYRLLETAPVA
jgi:hypothetical protein